MLINALTKAVDSLFAFNKLAAAFSKFEFVAKNIARNESIPNAVNNGDVRDS